LKHIKMIKVLFFGKTQDIAGKREAFYSASGLNELIKTLVADYPLLGKCSFNIAVNGVLQRDDKKLEGNDTVALLPPYAGG